MTRPRLLRMLRATGLVAVGATIGSGALWAGGLATQAEIGGWQVSVGRVPTFKQLTLALKVVCVKMS